MDHELCVQIRSYIINIIQLQHIKQKLLMNLIRKPEVASTLTWHIQVFAPVQSREFPD